MKLAAPLKSTCQAVDAGQAEQRLQEFEKGEPGQKYPMIGKAWRSNWERMNLLFAFSMNIRKTVSTTSSVESLSSVIRRMVNKRGHVPATLRGIFLVLPLAAAQVEPGPGGTRPG